MGRQPSLFESEPQRELTLNEELAARGYTTQPAVMSKKHILRDGQVVFTGNAHEVWEWITSKG